MSAMVLHCHGCGEPFDDTRRLSARGRPLGRIPKWCSERCRKQQYARPCVDCGAPRTNGSESAGPHRCHACAMKHVAEAQRVWTAEKIIERMREWASLWGEPPAAADWNPTMARHYNDEPRARRFERAHGHWPRHRTVFNVFGSWNAAVRAAGFKPRARFATRENRARAR